VTTIDVNSEYRPVNILTVVGDVTRPVEHECVARFLEALLAFANKRELYANILDLTHCGALSPVERQFIGDTFNAHVEIYKQYLVCVTVILRSPVVRGALTAIGWIHPYPMPVEFANDYVEAERKTKKLLAKRGIEWLGFGDGRACAMAVGRK